MSELEELASKAQVCVACDLAASRTNVVFGVGDEKADLMFIGEGPGREEDLAGEPFVGRSGRLLDQLIAEELGLARSDCYIANVVKCRPPGNRDPLPAEVAACRHFLTSQLAAIDPVVVITLGNFASRAVLETTEGVTRLRGKSYPVDGRLVVPTFHPAAALRGGGVVLAQMRADFVRAKAAIGKRSAGAPMTGSPTETAALSLRCADPHATRAFGAAIAGLLMPGDVVLLTGELGAGKTTFVKGVVEALGGTSEATSPTFVLCHLYDSEPPIAHVDCWRLNDRVELVDLALEEVLDDGGVALIEWGELAARDIGGEYLCISFSIEETATPGSDAIARHISCAAFGPGWQARLAALPGQSRDIAWQAGEAQ